MRYFCAFLFVILMILIPLWCVNAALYFSYYNKPGYNASPDFIETLTWSEPQQIQKPETAISLDKSKYLYKFGDVVQLKSDPEVQCVILNRYKTYENGSVFKKYSVRFHVKGNDTAAGNWNSGNAHWRPSATTTEELYEVELVLTK